MVAAGLEAIPANLPKGEARSPPPPPARSTLPRGRGGEIFLSSLSLLLSPRPSSSSAPRIIALTRRASSRRMATSSGTRSTSRRSRSRPGTTWASSGARREDPARSRAISSRRSIDPRARSLFSFVVVALARPRSDPRRAADRSRACRTRDRPTTRRDRRGATDAARRVRSRRRLRAPRRRSRAPPSNPRSIFSDVIDFDFSLLFPSSAATTTT
eukprot:30548-Pelagococcus_subviridis.AAC.1